jgi:hypothetical protein
MQHPPCDQVDEVRGDLLPRPAAATQGPRHGKEHGGEVLELELPAAGDLDA